MPEPRLRHSIGLQRLGVPDGVRELPLKIARMFLAFATADDLNAANYGASRQQRGFVIRYAFHVRIELLTRIKIDALTNVRKPAAILSPFLAEQY